MKRALALVLGLFVGAQAAQAQPADQRVAFDFSFEAIDGAPMQLAPYRGKVLLVVNTASRCGFTPQYEGLEALWQRYKDRGLVVIGVPSNDFGGQEPGSNQEIAEFCDTHYRITFPLTAKTVVKGEDAHPFYRWAAAQEQGSRPKWNFHKYVIGRDGRLIESFTSLTGPDSEALKKTIDAAISVTEAQ